MKIRLLHDAAVRFPAGTVLDVPEGEARKLIAFNNAEEAKEKETPKKKPAK
jgi:hypothetical protein